MGRTFDRAVSTPSMDAAIVNNILLNGRMDVSNENGTTQITLANNVTKYTVDQFTGYYFHTAATAVIKAQQVAPPGSPAFGAGFSNCLQMTATTAHAMAGASDVAYLTQPIEGLRLARLGFGNATNPQYVTVGFWVYATIAGTMTVSLVNAAVNRTYLQNVTINAAATWEYKTITFLGDTTGTWVATNALAATLRFCFGSGTGAQGSNNVWNAANYASTSSTTNFFASNNNTVCITGVGMWAGTDAPTAAKSPLAFRSFGEEFTLCQRYYQKTFAHGVTPAQNAGFTDSLVGVAASSSAGAISYRVYFAPVLRAAPTFTTYNTNAADADWWDTNASASRAAVAAELTTVGVRLVMNAASTIGAQHFINWVANARL